MKKLLVIVTTLLLWLSASIGHAAVPPGNSPIAKGEHPRLFLTVNDLVTLRTLLATTYATKFQSFITELDSKFDTSASSKSDWERRWGGINYAFLGLMDPQATMSNFSSAHTKTAYCQKAVEYAKTLLPDISANTHENHNNLVVATDGPIYLPPTIVYDWCNNLISSSDKLSLVQAFINNYQHRQNPKRLLIDNQDTMKFHNALPVLAFYNDTLAGAYAGKTYAEWQTEMYNWFHDIWVNQYVDTVNYFYKAAGGHEGPSYGANAYVNGVFAIGAISSALDRDYFVDMPYFSTYPLYLLASTKPLMEEGIYYNNRWGDIGSGKSKFSCQSSHLSIGTLKKFLPDLASLQKWHLQRIPHCSDYPNYGGQWANAVFYSFLWGHQEVSPKSPAQLGIDLAQKLGQGKFVFRTGYEDISDTMIAFWATDFVIQPGGHSHHHISHFTLDKFGNLILKPGNAKSPSSEKLENDDGALFHNVVGIHDPNDSNDTYMNYDKQTKDSIDDLYTSPHYQPGGNNNKGIITASDIHNKNGYDYVSYDFSIAWLNKAVLSQREFVYIHGNTNKEFLIILDRIITSSPNYEKNWHIWVPSQPVFSNGYPTQQRTGKWVSTDTNMMMVTNNYTGNDSHGRIFLKTLSPVSHKTTAIGGPPNHYFEDTKGNLVPDRGIVYPLTAEQENRLGWGRIEIQPSTAQNEDTFLNVIQFGEANSLPDMSSSVRINSEGSNMIGAHIGDNSNQWIIMFTKNSDEISQVNFTKYTFNTLSITSKHLLFNMIPLTKYYIKSSISTAGIIVIVDIVPDAESMSVNSNNQGVLRFDLGGSPLVDSTPPAPPMNMRSQ
jgi:hypothetical protein